MGQPGDHRHSQQERGREASGPTWQATSKEREGGEPEQSERPYQRHQGRLHQTARSERQQCRRHAYERRFKPERVDVAGPRSGPGPRLQAVAHACDAGQVMAFIRARLHARCKNVIKVAARQEENEERYRGRTQKRGFAQAYPYRARGGFASDMLSRYFGDQYTLGSPLSPLRAFSA